MTEKRPGISSAGNNPTWLTTANERLSDRFPAAETHKKIESNRFNKDFQITFLHWPLCSITSNLLLPLSWLISLVPCLISLIFLFIQSRLCVHRFSRSSTVSENTPETTQHKQDPIFHRQFYLILKQLIGHTLQVNNGIVCGIVGAVIISMLTAGINLWRYFNLHSQYDTYCESRISKVHLITLSFKYHLLLYEFVSRPASETTPELSDGLWRNIRIHYSEDNGNTAGLKATFHTSYKPPSFWRHMFD